MYLISACLCGINCKYNGGNNYHPYFQKLLHENKVVPVCPEDLGGLPTPRTPCEIYAGGGEAVLKGHNKVINKDGIDVTSNFLKGAYKTLTLAQNSGIKMAILKSRSPSCGVGQIYDGSFNSILIPGDGVTTALLKKCGFTVISDECYLKNANGVNEFESS